MATATNRITSQSIRENAKRDHSPKWDGADSWSTSEFYNRYRDAMRYYNMESSSKELKPKVIDWMGRNGYDKDQIREFKKTKDWRSHTTMGAIAACLIKGMPAQREDFNKGRSSVDWLKKQIAEVVEHGRHDVEIVEEDKSAKSAVPVINIQERVRDAAGDMSEEIDVAIDSWITDPDSFNPKEMRMVSLLRGKGAKAAHTRYIKGFYQRGLDELLELTSGAPDDQLKESYKHVNKKNVKKLADFYEGIMLACDQIAAEAKILKKPRPAKIKPAEELVKKLKFLAVDDKLGIVSVPPANIIGAQAAVVYNTKTRKIGIYISKTSSGLAVKGTTITEFTEKSFQRTLRKPAEQIKEFKEQNTQKRVDTWFTKIKTTETILNGRINEDIVILKTFK
jgi:hypothetical protein